MGGEMRLPVGEIWADTRVVLGNADVGELRDVLTSQPVRVPANLGATLPGPDRNPTTAEGIALGRALFFDRRLSGPNTIACADCHQPERCYSDGRVRSVGASGEPLLRHTPALINLAWANGTFWDGGAKNLESQVFGPLASADEMAADVRTLVAELREDPQLRAAFERAFPGQRSHARHDRARAGGAYRVPARQRRAGGGNWRSRR